MRHWIVSRVETGCRCLQRRATCYATRLSCTRTSPSVRSRGQGTRHSTGRRHSHTRPSGEGGSVLAGRSLAEWHTSFVITPRWSRTICRKYQPTSGSGWAGLSKRGSHRPRSATARRSEVRSAGIGSCGSETTERYSGLLGMRFGFSRCCTAAGSTRPLRKGRSPGELARNESQPFTAPAVRPPTYLSTKKE